MDVPWWSLTKIVEGEVNKTYHKVIRMTLAKAWELNADQWKILLDKQEQFSLGAMLLDL